MTLRSLLLPSMVLALSACGDDKSSGDDGTSGTTPSVDDTAEPDDTGDSGDTGETDDSGDPDPVDMDGDGYDTTSDCDDSRSDVHPGATEWVDGLNNDCDEATSEAGRATWWGADGPVDVTDTLGTEWVSEGDGRLALGDGDWPVTFVVGAEHDVTIEGFGDVRIETPDLRAVYVQGEATLTNLTVEAYSIDVHLDATLVATDLTLVNGTLWMYQGASADLTRLTIDGGWLSAITAGGMDPAPRTAVLRESTITSPSWGIVGIDDLTLESSTVAADGIALANVLHAVVDGSTLTSLSTAVSLGTSAGDLAAEMVMRDSIVSGYGGITQYPGTTLEVVDSGVEVERVAYTGTAATATFTRSMVASTTVNPVSVSGSTGRAELTIREVVFGTVSSRHINTSGEVELVLEDSVLEGAADNALRLDAAVGSTFAVRRCTFRNNHNTGSGSGWRGYGGAVWFNGAGSTLVLEDNTFEDNSVSLDGGALFATDGTVTMSGNTFSGNAARHGGALYLLSSATVSSSGDTFTGNVASGSGGVVSYSGDLSFEDTVMTENDAIYGGAVSTSGMLTLTGTWDLGEGSTDNTPDDYYWANGSFESTSIGSGSGTLVCGDGTAECVAVP
mgnify:FL=1